MAECDYKVGDLVWVEVPSSHRGWFDTRAVTHFTRQPQTVVEVRPIQASANAVLTLKDPGGLAYDPAVYADWCRLAPDAVEPEPAPECVCPSMRLASVGHSPGCCAIANGTYAERSRRGW